MIKFQIENKEEFRELYARRNVIEGVFRAFKKGLLKW